MGVDFSAISKFVADNANIAGTSLVKLDESNNLGGHSVSIRAAGEDSIGGKFLGWRSDEQKNVNNQIRDQFLKSVLNRLGLSNASQLPEDVKKAMELKDYCGIFGDASSLTAENGGTTSGKPLSLRRIRTVVEAVKDYESHHKTNTIAEHINQLKDKLKSRHGWVEESVTVAKDWCVNKDCKAESDNACDAIVTLAKKLRDHFKDVDWTKKNFTSDSKDEFVNLLVEIGRLVTPGRKTSMDILEMSQVLAVRAYMKATPAFADFVNRHMQLITDSLGYDGLDEIKGLLALKASTVLPDALHLDRAIRLADELVQMKDVDCLARLGEMDVKSLKAFVKQGVLYPGGSLAKVAGMVEKFVTDRFVSPLKDAKTTEEALDWLKTKYPNDKDDVREMAGWFRPKGDAAFNERLSDMRAKDWHDDKADDDNDDVTVVHGHKLSTESVDDFGKDYQTYELQGDEFEILHDVKNGRVFYNHGKDIKFKYDDSGDVKGFVGVKGESVVARLVHEVWYNDENHDGDVCREQWYDRNGAELKE